MTQSRSVVPSSVGTNINNNTHNHTNKSTKLSRPTKSFSIISKPPVKINFPDIVHDPNNCMFKVALNTNGSAVAALCYLPTRYNNVIEFYHIEIPTAYRNQGLGDLLLAKAFEWVEKKSMRVIPTCPFVLGYLESHFPDKKTGSWSCIFTQCIK